MKTTKSHSLRHTATAQEREKMSLDSVRRQRGHANAGTIENYLTGTEEFFEKNVSELFKNYRKYESSGPLTHRDYRSGGMGDADENNKK